MTPGLNFRREEAEDMRRHGEIHNCEGTSVRSIFMSAAKNIVSSFKESVSTERLRVCHSTAIRFPEPLSLKRFYVGHLFFKYHEFEWITFRVEIILHRYL